MPKILIMIMPPWPSLATERHECCRCGAVAYTGSKRPPEGWCLPWAGTRGDELCGNCSQPRTARAALAGRAA